jgi:hypothetical protein
VLTRCGAFLDRPSQADLLHVDLRWNSQPIAIDPGTYSYNDEPPWNNPLAETRYHNTVTVNHLNQMRRVSRFLWLPWLHGKRSLPVTSVTKQIVYWTGRHDGYEPVAGYTREIVLLGSDCCVVVDVTAGVTPHVTRLHWLVEDYPYDWNPINPSLILQTPSGGYTIHGDSGNASAQWQVIRKAAETPQGWRARYYGERVPAISLSGEVTASVATFRTVFAPSSYRVKFEKDRIEIRGSEDLGIASGGVRFGSHNAPFQIDSIQWNGDQLDVSQVRTASVETVGAESFEL